MLRRLYSTLLPVVLAIVTTSAAPGTWTPAPVVFELDSRGAILVPLTIGGDGFTFVLDTGSSRSSIGERAAARLRAPVVARSEVASSSSSGPTVMQPVVRLPTLRVGSARKSGMLATVLRSSQLRSLAGKADGILGMDFLAGRRYMLDFHRKLLRWEPGRETGVPNAIHVQVRRSEGRSLVAVAGGGHAFWFVADSGADTLILFRSEDRPALPTLKLDGRVVLDTAGGRSVADRVLVSELRLGELTLRNVPAIELRVERDLAEVDGLLPLHLFAQVFFDPDSESMTVVPR